MSTMIEGRLVWSYTESRSNGFSWWKASSCIDTFAWYTLQRVSRTAWRTYLWKREPGSANDKGFEIIGESRYLKDAKRVADEHHHGAIKAAPSHRLQHYIARWPL